MTRFFLWPMWMSPSYDHERRQRTESRPPDLERRQPDSTLRNGGNSSDGTSLPLWLQAIKTLGTTGAIAVFLVWVGSNELPKIARQTEVNAQAILQLQEQFRQQAERDAALYRMMQRLCSNTAKNDDERTRCFEK